MSELSKALKAAMAAKDLKQSDLARLSKLQNSWLSRLLNGQNKSVSRSKIEKLIRPFDLEQQTLLVAAHCKDAIVPEKFTRKIVVSIK